MTPHTPPRAMILAAGYGTRLFPLTIERAKPAIPFMNRPLVGYVAAYLARHGCREVAVNLHHAGESIRRALGDGSRFGVRLEYVEEPEILGTGGALSNARGFLEGGTFVVINGKIVTDIDLTAALVAHRASGALATLVLRRNPARERFSVVEVSDDNRIIGFGVMPAPPASDGDREIGSVEDDTRSVACESDDEESRQANHNSAPLMFTGIQILEPEIFSFIPPRGFSHTTTDVYPAAIERGEKVFAHVAEGMWHELSTIERYLDTSLAVMEVENLEYVCGENCIIGKEARVGRSVIWDDVVIGDGARLDECVVGDGVAIPPGSIYSRAAIVRADVVRGETRPPKALPGEFEGENFVVPLPR